MSTYKQKYIETKAKYKDHVSSIKTSKDESETAQSAKYFVDSLYSVLFSKNDMKHKCFDAGAFVFADTEYILFQHLYKLFYINGQKRPNKTHIQFWKNMSRTDLKLTLNKQYEYTKQGKKQIKYFEVNINPLITKMCGTSVSKQVLFFYLFHQNKHPYIYLKIESSPSFSIKHGKDAFNTYVLKIDKTSKHRTRREKSYLISDKEFNNLSDEDKKTIFDDDMKHKYRFGDNYVVGYDKENKQVILHKRIGDEYVVGTEDVKKLLNKLIN